MKRRGFLAALAAIPFIGRWVEPRLMYRRVFVSREQLLEKYGQASGVAMAATVVVQDAQAREFAGRWEIGWERVFASVGIVPMAARADVVFGPGDRETAAEASREKIRALVEQIGAAQERMVTPSFEVRSDG